MNAKRAWLCQSFSPGLASAQTNGADLQRLSGRVLTFAQTVECAIFASVEALQERGAGSLQQLIVLEHQVGHERFAIEVDCLTLLANRTLSEDRLRILASILEIASELEHIGGYISGIAKIRFMMVQMKPPFLNMQNDLELMAAELQDMLKQAIEAFTTQDPALARLVLTRDDKVDALHSRIYKNLLAHMRGSSHAELRQARHLAQIARNLERAADRVTNVCEWVIFAISGELTPPESAI